MSITLTIEAADAADLQKQLNALAWAQEATATGTPDIAPAPPKNTRKPKDPEPVVETKAAEPEQLPQDAEPVTETNAEPEADASADRPLTYEDDIKPAVLKVSAKHGRPGVEKLLADFGAANAKEIPEAKWPELLAEIGKLLA